jgi:hypothetical protein
MPTEANWYLAAVTLRGGKMEILDVRPCGAAGYVEAWREAGRVRRDTDAPCVVVIDAASARLWRGA